MGFTCFEQITRCDPMLSAMFNRANLAKTTSSNLPVKSINEQMNKINYSDPNDSDPNDSWDEKATENQDLKLSGEDMLKS
jgi:hypothetical protein